MTDYDRVRVLANLLNNPHAGRVGVVTRLPDGYDGYCYVDLDATARALPRNEMFSFNNLEPETPTAAAPESTETQDMATPAPATAATPSFADIPLASLQASPTNPRKSFDSDALAELAANVERHGVLQPILVRPWPAGVPHLGDTAPQYEIVAGERRFRASRLAGRETIPAIIRELDDLETLEIQVIENLQRQDLHPLEEAEGYARLLETHGYSADTLAERIGKSRSYIYGRLKLTALCETVRQQFLRGELAPWAALLVARLATDDLQREAARVIWNSGTPMSARTAKLYISQNFQTDLTRAEFSLEREDLGAVSCAACPQRAGNNPALYPDTDADVCTNPACYAEKNSALRRIQKADAIMAGHTVLEGDAARKMLADREEYVPIYSYLQSAPELPFVAVVDVLKSMESEPPTILVERPGDGSLMKMYDKAALLAAALAQVEKNGKSASQQKIDDREALSKQHMAEAEAITAARVRLADAVYKDDLATYYGNPAEFLTPETLANVAELMLGRLTDYESGIIAQIVSGTVNDPASVPEINLAELGIHQLLGIINLAMLDDQFDVDQWESNGQVNPPEQLLAAAAARGLDGQGILDGTPTSPMDPQPPELGVGYVVRVREDARGKTGKRRKCAGRIGTIESLDGSVMFRGYRISVRFAPGKDGLVTDLTADELEVMSLPTAENQTPPTLAAQAQDLESAENPAPTAAQAADLDTPEPQETPENPSPADAGDIERNETPTDAPTAKGGGKTPQARYRHPENSLLNWTGRGKKPGWVTAWIDKGGSLADLVISEPEQAATAPTAKESKGGKAKAKGSGKAGKSSPTRTRLAPTDPERDPNTLDLPGVGTEAASQACGEVL